MDKLGIIWSLPFFCTLFSIAICPLLIPEKWEKHSLKILAIAPIILLIALTIKFSFALSFHELMHSLLIHYFPLMALLFSLFTITGGIHISINKELSPALNTIVLFIGSILAGWIGTTGASMLLIRPLLKINDGRKHVTHLVIFFIFTVSNIGGAMTPLGDPPLFMGFLEGVDFFWTVKHLYTIIGTTLLIILALFYIVDSFLIKKEHLISNVKNNTSGIVVTGTINIFLLFLIVSFSMLSGIVHLGKITILSVNLESVDVIKDITLVLISILSLKITPKTVRDSNKFTFASFKEVAEIFIAIFITIIPVTEMLQAGSNGCFASIFNWVSGGNSQEINPFRIFWACGGISSVLDNAPSYIMFFHLAGGDPEELMNSVTILKAISLGSVYMGAMTYIGNAPNLMVRSISIERGINMPSFFGYMVWSAVILLPLFLLGSVLLF